MQFNFSVAIYVLIMVIISLGFIWMYYLHIRQKDARNTFIPDEPLNQDTIIQQYVTNRLENGKSVTKEMEVIKAMLIKDKAYAWSWYCNLVIAFADEGCPKPIAMQGAARFLMLLANVNIKNDVRFIEEYCRLTKTPI